MDASFNTLRTLSLTGGILSLSLLLGACTDADAINPTEEISEAVIAIPVEAAAVTKG